MKIQILIPTYKFIPTEVVQSLMAICASLSVRNDRWNVAFANGFNAAYARTELMNYVNKQPDLDYVLWIDSDHIFTIENVDNLIKTLNEHNLECLSAGYFVRDGSKTFAHGRFNADRSFKKLEKAGCRGLTECDIFGFGFLLMKPQLIKEMVDKFPNDLFKFDCINYTTEDVYFCKQMQSLGKKLYFDADNIVGHLMTAVNK